MSIRQVAYYQVHCDEAGCDRSTGDTGEYSAWSSREDAQTDWEEGWGIALDDGRTFCETHSVDKRCAGCDYKGTDLTEYDEDRWCPKCLQEEIQS